MMRVTSFEGGGEAGIAGGFYQAKRCNRIQNHEEDLIYE